MRIEKTSDDSWRHQSKIIINEIFSIFVFIFLAYILIGLSITRIFKTDYFSEFTPLFWLLVISCIFGFFVRMNKEGAWYIEWKKQCIECQNHFYKDDLDYVFSNYTYEELGLCDECMKTITKFPTGIKISKSYKK